MAVDRTRLVASWRRVFAQSWPVMVEELSTTLIRTTDIVVTALFSPAAIAALGIADLYARISGSLGSGLGASTIAISSQETGRGGRASRDEALTQAVLLGVATGLPFALVGLATSPWLFAVLGARSDVVALGGAYLAIVFAISPIRHLARVEARALQGTGDTRTPMIARVAANGLNVFASLVLGLGLGPVPALDIVGVGLATAAGTSLAALILTVAIWRFKADLGFVRPRNRTIGKQLCLIALPRVGESLLSTAAELPFNALLLAFGTGVNAAYQIGRLVGDHFSNPVSVGLHVTASILVGQELGAGDVDAARRVGRATAALGLVVLGGFGAVVVVAAEWLVGLLTSDPATLPYAVGFTRAFGLAAPFLGLYVVFAGALQGAGDTRTPFLARTIGLFGFMLGASYLLSVPLGLGVTGAYVGIVGYYAWTCLVNAAGFAWGDWPDRAAALLAKRDLAAAGDLGD